MAIFNDNIKKEIKVAVWSYKTAWSVDKSGILLWGAINMIGSLIPVIFLLLTGLIVDNITRCS
jgi:hypothetical protein